MMFSPPLYIDPQEHGNKFLPLLISNKTGHFEDQITVNNPQDARELVDYLKSAKM